MGDAAARQGLAAAAAQALAFDEERQALNARIWHYRRLLEEHGVEVDGADPLVSSDAMAMYRASKRVVEAAGELLAALRALEEVYGTSLELVGGQSWTR